MTNQKIQLVKEAIKRQLDSINFISTDDVKTPLIFRLTNNSPNGAFNVLKKHKK